MKKYTFGIMGAGAWGSALARHAAKTCGSAKLWCYEKDVADDITGTNVNSTYLPGIKLGDVRATADMGEFLEDLEVLTIVVPSHTLRHILKDCGKCIPAHIPVICATKGIENETLMTMDEVMADVLGEEHVRRFAYLSGPTFANDVARDLESAATLAGRDPAVVRHLQKMLSNRSLRLYSSDDVVGVEYGGALKNVIAIAAGAVQGLELGDNAMAALVTRGIAEVTRLAVACNACPLTLAGLSGMGDLVLTCYGKQSRNRQVGEEIAKGATLESILSSRHTVAEGVKTALSAHRLALKMGIDMPITKQVYEGLYENKNALTSVSELMDRRLKAEHFGDSE